MVLINEQGRRVDVVQGMELNMWDKRNFEILSVSHEFWKNHPDKVAILKKRNPDLTIDGSLQMNPSPEPFGVNEDGVKKEKKRIFGERGKIHFVIYPNYLPKVGGIETAVYELAKLLDKDKYYVSIAYFGVENEDVVKRYEEVANVVNLHKNRISCDVCLIASNHLQPEEIKAKKWIQWVHSDYEKYNNLQLVKNPDVTQYVAVSKHVAKVIKRMAGVDCKVIYNLLDPDFGKGIKKPIRFVSNTRISREKGFENKSNKMLKFARLLKESGANFIWTICGDNSHDIPFNEAVIERFKDIPEVKFVGFKKDILPTLIEADYLIQLSDFEGCPYAILEALQVGVPCIVSKWYGVEELVKDGVNGYIINQDIKNVDIDKILNEIPSKFLVKPKSTIKQWENLIDKVEK